MLTLNRILVATDFSGSAAHARARAAHFARAVGAELHTLHVVSDAQGDPSSVRNSAPDGIARRRARTPAEGILAYAEEHAADLIVVGTRGRAGVERWVLGSVAETVVRQAACPVLVVRDDLVRLGHAGPAPPRQIVVGLDLDRPTSPLVAYAREVAALAGARVDFLHVLERPAAFRLFELEGFRAALPRLASQTRERLHRVVNAGRGPHVPARCFVLTGDPAREIVRYADVQAADLVFLGTYGEPGGLVLGGVTERVMRAAPCPVLTLNAATTLPLTGADAVMPADG